MEERCWRREAKTCAGPGNFDQERSNVTGHCPLINLFASAFYLDPPQLTLLILQEACRYDFFYHLPFRPNSPNSYYQPQMRWTWEVAVPLD